jgi:NAD(P)-dependent dehydrogenase (short-subunit alcohol dehydrogenase family)
VRGAGARNGPYTASKAALEAVALTLAKEEAGSGVRVNIVAPSLVESPQAQTVLARKGVTDTAVYYAGLPWGRALSVDEVAEVIVGIGADEQWRYLTGQVLRMAADIGSR